MSIYELYMDRDEPAHLVYQTIPDMELIVDAIAEGVNWMYQLFVAYFLVNGSAAL